jgi:putative selenium metabolism hydrolase
MVSAGSLLKALSYDGPYSVIFTFTVMEEDCDGLCWKYLIEREKMVPDCAVITEPTNLGLYRGQRGRMEMDVSYRGVSAHGSAPERGENAVYKAAEGILKIRELHGRLAADEFLGSGSAAVTAVSSQGPSLCAIPDGAAFHIDRRLTWGETEESAVEEVQHALGDEAAVKVPQYDRPSYRGTVFRQEMVFPTWKLPEDHPLWKAGTEAHRRLFDKPPRSGKWTFSTNGVAICGRAGIPTIGFGPGDEVYAHSPNERIPLDHLAKASAFYAMLPYVLAERLP